MPNSLNGHQRRALQILAGVPRGIPEAAMVAHGFEADMLAGLVLAGLVTVVTETVRAGGPTIKTERFLSTDAGGNRSVTRFPRPDQLLIIDIPGSTG